MLLQSLQCFNGYPFNTELILNLYQFIYVRLYMALLLSASQMYLCPMCRATVFDPHKRKLVIFSYLFCISLCTFLGWLFFFQSKSVAGLASIPLDLLLFHMVLFYIYTHIYMNPFCCYFVICICGVLFFFILSVELYVFMYCFYICCVCYFNFSPVTMFGKLRYKVYHCCCY